MTINDRPDPEFGDMAQLPDDHQAPRIGVDISSYGQGHVGHDLDEGSAQSEFGDRLLGFCVFLIFLALMAWTCVEVWRLVVTGN